jgi:membrane-associated protease RseP (regulator of RpoE activity)
MAADLRQQMLGRMTAELFAFEAGLAAWLEQEREAVRPHPEALAIIERFVPIVGAQRDQLAAYLKSTGVEESGTSGFTFNTAIGVSGALRRVSDAFNHGTMSYVMLYEMALRLYEPPLREIAPKHLKVYVDGGAEVSRLLPTVVAWELAQDGLYCSCVCPMCGLGACGCVAFGTQTLASVWREAIGPEVAQPGFFLQPPKPESELARAGMQGGERLLAVDGHEVRFVADIQAAIRKHMIGEDVQLLIQRGSEAPIELTVKHVSDHPKA